MIHTLRECRETNRMLNARLREGREAYEEAMDEIRVLRQAGEIGNNFSLRTLFEETVEDGRELLHEMEERKKARSNVIWEAAGDAITTMKFSNIIGQIAYADVLENFENGEFIGEQLVTTMPATTQQKEVIPGITMIGDSSQKIGEGQEYPVVGLGEQYVTAPEIDKHGFVMNITEEAIFEDKTGLLLNNFNKAAEGMAINQEKERLDVALGITNTYSRNGGPEQSTYANSHTQGDFDNLIASNGLTDYANIEAAWLAFQAVTDPETGEPIMLGGPIQLVCPQDRAVRAYRILNALEVRTGDITTGSGTQTITGNPIAAMGDSGRFQIVTNQYVKNRTASASTWFFGNFKKAFGERVIYPTQVQTEDRTSAMSFERDVVSRIKVRRKTVPFTKEPRYVQKHTE